MSHYAKVKNGIVVSTIVASSEFFEDFCGQYNANSYMVGQGCDVSHFNDEDDSILLVENNEEANYLVHCALVKTAFFVGDDLNIDYKDAYSRIINYIKDNDLHSDIHNLIKKLRVIVPDNLIT